MGKEYIAIALDFGLITPGTDRPSSKTPSAAAAKKDTILGNTGNNSLMGGAGNDLIVAGKGQDTVNGQDGNDTLSDS